MRIAFVGKGGSGKTTVASLFAMQMAHDGLNVLALDADINQHLAGAVDINEELPSMGLRLDEIKRYLTGSNSRFSEATMQKTTPPGNGSQLVSVSDNDWFVKTFSKVSPEGVRVAGAGEIPEGNIGVKCYHGLNGAVELVLGHMIDGPNDVVVVDMTAGADAFSSSLFTKVDALVLVVEPTMKSMSVYEQFAQPTKQYNVPLMVVANKIADSEDETFITEHIGEIITAIPLSTYVKRRERGQEASLDNLDQPVVAALRKIHEHVQALGRDWNEIEQRMHAMHLKNAKSWMGEDAKKHIDTSFSLKSVAENLL